MWRLPFLLILGYRYVVSPLLPSTCRFTPSCSAYGLEAYRCHGLLRGSWLVFRRVTACHPWHPGGFDPVPGKPVCTNNQHDLSVSSTLTDGDSCHG